MEKEEFEHRIANIEYLIVIQNVGYRTPNAECDTEYPMPNIELRIPNSEYRIPNSDTAYRSTKNRIMIPNSNTE